MATEETKESDVFEPFRKDFPMLIEAGFVAVKQLDGICAQRIFQAAQMLNPHNVAPKVGMGYIALNKLELKEGKRIFQEVLEEEPDNWLAQTFLGICYLLSKSKQSHGEKLIQEAMEKTDDPTIVNLGKVSLEWAEKDLKKMKSPFFQAEDANAKEE
ncbi:MAG: SctF chaperone SctG [Waddliaceae bacterium]